MAEDLGALASQPSGFPTAQQAGLFVPPQVIEDRLPAPDQGAAGVVPGMIEPSGGHNPATPGAMTMP